MFGKDRANVAFDGKIENVLGANTRFDGQLKAQGNIRVDGYFDGSIETAGNVVIGQAARVNASIVANNVQVWGALQGRILASGRLEILPSGRVWGEVRVAALLIDEGGVFRGENLIVGKDEEPFLLEGGSAKPPSTGEES